MAGKGPQTRKGANFRAYWDADYWTLLEQRKAEAAAKETEHNAEECASPEQDRESS